MSHYEGLRWLSARVGRGHGLERRRVLTVIFGVCALHALEIGLYAMAYLGAMQWIDGASFGGARTPALADLLYFSAETFTALGMGDLYPLGDLRLIASVEAVNGPLLLGWSTAFTCVVMQRFWKLD